MSILCRSSVASDYESILKFYLQRMSEDKETLNAVTKEEIQKWSADGEFYVGLKEDGEIFACMHVTWKTKENVDEMMKDFRFLKYHHFSENVVDRGFSTKRFFSSPKRKFAYIGALMVLPSLRNMGLMTSFTSRWMRDFARENASFDVAITFGVTPLAIANGSWMKHFLAAHQTLSIMYPTSSYEFYNFRDLTDQGLFTIVSASHNDFISKL